MTHLDEVLEEIAQRGCLEVNQIINQLDSGKSPAPLEQLKPSERDYIYNELKAVMAIYEGGVCSL